MNILNWFKKQEQKSAPAPQQEQAFDRFLELEEAGQNTSAPAAKLTREEQDEILNRVFPVQKAALYDSNTGKYAMDADFGFSQMKGLITDSGRQDDRIFRFYGKHSFIGWQLCAMISQNWLVSNACAVPADDAVRPGWKNTVKSISGEDIDPAELTELTLKKYHLAEKCRQHIKNSRIFGVSYALLCVDGIDYSQPFNLDGVRPGSFKGISIIDPVWITPQWSAGALNNPASPNFYEPTYYQTNGAGRIHASHIIKLVHEEVPDLLKPSYYFGGLPLTQEIYERVYAAERTANEAPLLALTKRLLVVPTSLPRLIGKPQEAWDLIKMLIFGRDNQGIYFTEAGEKNQVHQVDTSLSDLDAVIMSQYQLVAAISRIPAHKLLKTDPKGLNNNGEYTIKDYNQELQSLQEKGLRTLIERVNALTLRSDLPHLEGVQEILTEFNPIDMPTEKEKAEVENLQAQAASAYVAAGILSPEEVRKTLRSEKGGKYADIDEELPAEEVPEDLELPDDDDGNEPQGGENPQNGGKTGGGAGSASDEWKEGDPRRDNGQFGTGSGQAVSKSEKTAKSVHFEKADAYLKDAKPVAKIEGNEFEGKTTDEKRNAAEKYFENNLRNKKFTNKDWGKEIKVLSGSKAIHEAFSEEKINAIKHLPDMLENAKYIGFEKDRKQRPNVKGFHYLACNVTINEKPQGVIMSVREDNNGNVFYNHILRKSEEGTVSLPAASVGAPVPSSMDSIAEINPKIKWHFGD
ncbi:MAG: anti-CBASS protein Acb1 family protein [Candidatus Avelusimicrobium sp.]|uniref:anti-CBASS protein Acb1 family protein n=1 Tax=Candidatus Avelusimicrobium sp. TaxID=3048833 RepID=UPI003EFF09F4